jgi:hypothetical protein
MIMISVLPTPSHEPAPFEISGNFKQYFISSYFRSSVPILEGP